jgi:serine/threonine protein kinase
VPDPFSERWSGLSLENKHLLLRLMDVNYVNRLKISDALQHSFFTEAAYPIDRQQIALKISNYYRGSNLVSTLESYLAFTHLPQHKRREYSHAFNLIDSDHDGLISKD